MTLKIKLIAFLFCNFLLGTEMSFAQNNPTSIKGRVVEEGGGHPIPFATIFVANKDTKKPITGTTSDDDGNFVLETDADNFYIEISFIGFKTKTFEQFTVKNGIIDLGTVVLSEDAQQLKEVVVEGELSTTEFKLDKRVFNVGKDISSTGMSALEVLNNVPSVNVNIEGQISLRGSQGVRVLINGKPSILASGEGNALGTITADMIERVEVITNPSAKYEAEGTSGIINIVLKKENREGLNGSITLNGGAPYNYSVGISLNRRTEKFNLFTQLGGGYREFPNEIENVNVDRINDTSILSSGTEYRNEKFYNFTLGTDYFITPNDVITLSGDFALELEEQPSNTSFAAIDKNNGITSKWDRNETTVATNPKFQYEFQYKKEFEGDEDHTLLFSALGNFFGKEQSSQFVDATISGENMDGDQKTRTDFKEALYTFKLDYTMPFSEGWSMEGGAQYVLNDVSNDYEVENLIGGDYVLDPNYTNVFNYNQNVFGLYGTGAFEMGKWGLKAGLRLEQTELNTLLEDTNEDNHQSYLDLFPSAHSSYKVNQKVSLQAGYSRRIFRPGLWDLNPFFNIRNNYSIRQGNPDLQPEYTDSYEVTSIYLLGKASVNLGFYYRYTTDVIERVSTFEDNVNTVTPENVGTNNATGIEFNFKYSLATWFSLNGDFNFGHYKRRGTFETEVFDFKGTQYSSKLLAKFKLPGDLDIEAAGNYESAYETVQSEIGDNLFMDLGVRKKLFKGKTIVSLSVRDVFASRSYESVTNQPDFYVYNKNVRGRFVSLGLSYGFGKGDAMQFTGWR